MERARENLEKMDNVTILGGDFLTYEFKRKFDIIYSSLTFMHIKEKQKAIQKVAELLNCNGRFLLSIDRNQSPYITYSARKIKVYPDTPKETAGYIMKSGMIVLEQYDTELATVFVAGKG